MQPIQHFSGKIIDVVNDKIYKGIVEIIDGKIASIAESDNVDDQYILPGLIDAHVHIESSMLIPTEFARLAVCHGTVATVSDPHEIANVLGLQGVEFMINNGNKTPFKFYFGAPSCVPATSFESSGATLNAADIEDLLKQKEIKYLSEMMNFPGVLYSDEEVIAKLNAAKKYNKPIDGHAPGLNGEKVKKYIESGISTDHECFTIEEALEKISYGMKVQIREGSAAKNFETLIPLINSHPDKIMLCSDDKHPDDLLEGHIDNVIKRAIKLGYNPLKVLKVCTYNPVKHYNLDVGLLQIGDPADFIIVDDLDKFKIKSTHINGEEVFADNKCLLQTVSETTPNIFKADFISESDIQIEDLGKKIKVLKAFDGQLITEKLIVKPKIKSGHIISDIEQDILKLVVLNRYRKTTPSFGFIKGFGFKKGAIASTVAHDSHNIIAVGTSDSEIVNAINLLIRSKGGITLSNESTSMQLPLPVAGIMSNEKGEIIAKIYKEINKAAKDLGSDLHAPYMTLSFMALLVIPDLKLSDKGLFDGNTFEFTDLFEN